MFHDQIDTVLFVDDFKEFDDILVIHVAEDVDLILEGGFDVMHEIGMGIFHSGEFDLLDCVGVAVVDLAEGARRNYLL